MHDGHASVLAVGDFDPHLILLDIGMPKLNGYEACLRIRLGPGGADRTLVAITGWGQPDDLLASKKAGFDDHWVKPVDPELLLDLIANLKVANR